jgi:hypothetical protein
MAEGEGCAITSTSASAERIGLSVFRTYANGPGSGILRFVDIGPYVGLLSQAFLAIKQCLPPEAPVMPIANDVVEQIQRMSDDIAAEACRGGARLFQTRGVL